jgi:outer membrane protein assembly factor BamB
MALAARAAPPPDGAAAQELPKVIHDWPCYLGPNGNFTESSGARLADDLSQSPQLWTSEVKDIGPGKISGKPNPGAKYPLPAGGAASPIVSGGLVIQAYFIPTGDAWDKFYEQQIGPAEFPKWKYKWLVSADDVVVAIDAATGKTRWRQVFAGKGANMPMLKRGGWEVTPAADGTRVFSLGTTGRLYALDLATGKLLWEKNVEPAHERLEKAKAQGIAEGRLVALDLYGGLIVVDGVLLVPDGAAGLAGFDPESGKQLWHLDKQTNGLTSGYNMPAPVAIDGQRYVITANRTGDLRLIRPKSGEVLWSHALKSMHLTQPVMGQKLLLAYEPAPHLEGDVVAGGYGLLAGYSIDLKGVRRVWTLPDKYHHELHKDGGPFPRILPREGIIYYLHWTNHPKVARNLVVVRESDGTVLSEREDQTNGMLLWGDKLITTGDSQHEHTNGPQGTFQALDIRDPADLKPTGKTMLFNNWEAGRRGAVAYELPMWTPFVDGLAWFRSANGDIVCWDLRQP